MISQYPTTTTRQGNPSQRGSQLPLVVGRRAAAVPSAIAFLLFAFGSVHAQHLLTPVADTYIQRNAATTNNGAATTINAKRESATGSGGFDRVGFLRFAAPAVLGTADDVRLYLTLTAGAGVGTTRFAFDLYGLNDGHADEGFAESLTFSTATSASTTASGSFNTAGTTYLGTFTSPNVAAPQVVTLGGLAIRDFIRANANAHLSFVIVRKTNETATVCSFASKEHATVDARPLLAIQAKIVPAAITASSVLDATSTNQASNATDGDLATRWTSLTDTSTRLSWVQLDFGSPQTVNRLDFITYEHRRRYKIESSNDGTTWSLVTGNFPSGYGSGVVNAALDVTTRYFAPRTARYFRLTSDPRVSNYSMSLWEIAAYNDTAMQSLMQARHATDSAAVAALANGTTDEQLKRVVLEVALERAQFAINVYDLTYADRMLDDVEARLSTAATTMTTTITGLPNISVQRPLNFTTTATNPYLKRLMDGATLDIATVDDVWEKNTLDVNWLGDFNLARSQGQEMESYLWVFAHPNSTLRHQPEVLRRVLRRTLNFIDAINVHTDSLAVGQLNSLYDDFAIGPASMALRQMPMVYPNLMPPNLAADWDTAITKAGNAEWAAYGTRVADWINTDVAIATTMENLGGRMKEIATATSNTSMNTQADSMLAKGRYFIDDVLASNRVFPDGAVGYIDSQNEAGGYQSTVENYVRRYYERTGRAQALTILQGMEWYGPINGRMFDWWTSPSWKWAWNAISGSGQTGESTNPLNPFVRAEMDTAINAAASASNWIGHQAGAVWYQGTVTPQSRGDYTVFDRNIVGPRAWYGRWNYTATLRAIADTDSGHSTIMGCQTMDPDPNFRVNASVFGVFPRIRTSSLPSRDSVDGSFAEDRHAWLTSKLEGDSTVNRDFSALGVSHKIHRYASSTKGTEFNWTARQVWLGLPDRIIGLVDLGPNVTTSAWEQQCAIRLGYGGTAYSSTKTIANLGGNTWSYGDLLVKLHNHSFAEVTEDVYTFRTVPFTEITLRDQIGGATDSTSNSYTTASVRGMLTEIRPNYAVGDVTATQLTLAGGLIGFEVDHPTTGRIYRVVYNPGTASANYTPSIAWTGPVRVHASGQRHRPDWVPAATGPLPSTYLISPSTVLTIPAKAHVVIERSSSLVKADNTNTLNKTESWTSSPLTDGALGIWDATVTADNTTTIGSGLNLAGIQVTNPGGNVAINPGTSGLLALGSAGIDLSTSARSLTLNAPMRLDSEQTWSTGSFGTSGAAQIITSGSITGSGKLNVVNASGRAVTLAGSNDFTGDVAIKSGALRITNSSSLGSGAKTILINSATTNALVLAGDGIVLPTTMTIQTSNPNGTIINENGNNRIEGNIQLTAGAGGTRFTSQSGVLTIAGNIAPTTTGRTLDLRGAGTGVLSGGITNGSGANTLTALTKNDSGTWTLSGSSNHSGSITLNAGTLENTGSITTSNSFTVALGATYRAQGSLTASAVTLAGALDFVPPSNVTPTTTVTLITNTGAATVSGTFTGKANNSTFTAGGLTWRINYDAGTGNDIVLSVVAAPIEQWRFTNFGNMLNAGPGLDTLDGDSDGVSNLIEYATNMNPALNDAVPQSATKAASVLEFVYTKNKSATDVTYVVEWSDTLLNDWSTTGVSAPTILSDNGTTQQIKVTVPAGSDVTKRFVHLKVTRP